MAIKSTTMAHPVLTAEDEELESLVQREIEAGNPWAILMRDARGPEWDAVIDSLRQSHPREAPESGKSDPLTRRRD